MGIEVTREAAAELWPEWQGALVNGAYPLLRILHGSDDGAVFVTDGTRHNVPSAAIRIVSTERVHAHVQLTRWQAATALSHPHLLRLLDSGRCQLGARQFLFVVMEYADQTLAQVLPHRALTSDEAREMLLPALDALDFLHRKSLVHGQLKPANFLVVNDRLKLASDAVRPAGEPRANIAISSLYDPPEAHEGRLSATGDIWALGVTLTEALTQSLPWPAGPSGTASLPATLPRAFAETVRRCLSSDPASRPSAASLKVQFESPPPAVVPAPTIVGEAPARATTQHSPASRRQYLPGIVAAGLFVLLAAAWAGLHVLHGQRPSQQATASTQPATDARVATEANPAIPPQPPVKVSPSPARAAPKASNPSPTRAPSRRPGKDAQPQAVSLPSVVHEEMPTPAPGALRTIHGRIKVSVLVIVDRSGKVMDALLENPGPSPYFSRVARDAAKKWTFSPAEQDSRQWLLRFEFGRDRATGNATPRF
jgi:TonB family protein